MKENILVVGGYGQVGKVVCSQLALTYPGKVIAAGRSIAKAKAFTKTMAGTVLPLELDIYNVNPSHEIFQQTKLVIMCLDQKDTHFVECCFQNSINYIDISPSYTILSKIERLKEKAEAAGVTAILGVGICPGLSNLLVKESKKQLDSITAADIYLLLGIGEKHGNDGVEWLVNHLNTSYTVTENNSSKRVNSFSDPHKVYLPGIKKGKTAYRFNLADQHILPKTLGIPSVSSRFCYDSSFITTEVFLLKKMGLFKLVRYPFIKKQLVRLMEKLLQLTQVLKLGTDTYIVKTVVKGTKEGKNVSIPMAISGRNNTKMTGATASVVAEALLKQTYPAGVYYIEELFTLEDFQKRGLSPTSLKY